MKTGKYLKVGLTVLLILYLTGCRNAPLAGCERTLHSEQISPDGNWKAAVLGVQCGATTADASWVLLTSEQNEFEGERDKVAVFEGRVENIAWQGNRLVVSYGDAKPFLMNRLAGEIQIIYVPRSQ